MRSYRGIVGEERLGGVLQGYIFFLQLRKKSLDFVQLKFTESIGERVVRDALLVVVECVVDSFRQVVRNEHFSGLAKVRIAHADRQHDGEDGPAENEDHDPESAERNDRRA